MHRTPLERVPRFRSRSNLRLRPVNRIKHVIDSQAASALGVTTGTTLIAASDTPDLAAPTEVQTGATVNGIYLKVELYPTTSAALANAYLIVFKNPSGNLSGFIPNTIGTNDNKRYVIHQEMVMMQKAAGANPRTLFNGVIAIPRGYRRFGPNDILAMNILAPGVNIDFCVQCHYKEFR